MLIREGILYLITATALLLAAPLSAEQGQIQTPPYFFSPDFFNDSVPQRDKEKLVPKYGGQLRMRIPSDIQDLNPITSLMATEREMQQLFNLDTFAWFEPETLEYVPWIAKRWQVQDVIETAEGERLAGMVTELEGTLAAPERLVFQPGAALVTVGRQDVESAPEAGANGTLTLKSGETWEGHTNKVGRYILEFIAAGEGEPRTFTPEDLQVPTLQREAGGDSESILVNKHCLWTLYLREGPTWQDGTPITATDAETSFEFLQNTYVRAQPLRNYYNDMARVEALDERTVQMELKRPYSLSYKTVMEFYTVPSHLIDEELYEGDDQAFGEYFNDLPFYKEGAQNTIGNGAYRLKEWNSGRIVLERWPDWWAAEADLPYWPKGAPYLDTIEYRTINSATAALNQMKNGEIDADMSVDPATFTGGEAKTDSFTDNFVKANTGGSAFLYIGWNHKNPILADAEVRRALAMMVPRQRIIEDVRSGMGRVVSGPYFMDGPIYDHSLKPLPFDPRQARRVLRRAGWADRDGDGILDKDGKPFSFSYLIHNARDYFQTVAEIMQEEFGKNGIEMKIEKLDTAIFIERVRGGEYDACRFAWSLNNFDDPDNYQIFHSSQAGNEGSNYGNYVNPKVDELIEAARLEFDRDKRYEINRELHRLFHEDQPYCFLSTLDDMFFFHKKYRNVRLFTKPPGFDPRMWYDGSLE